MSTRQKKPPPGAVVVSLQKIRKTPVDPREKAFNTAFGMRLRQAREHLEWPQERMAAALGIGYHQYKKYEYGKRSFPLYLLRDLSTIADRPIYWLLTGRG